MTTPVVFQRKGVKLLANQASDRAVLRLNWPLLVLVACTLCSLASHAAQVNVLTYHYDFARTGQNTNETILTPANVVPSSFGLLFSYPVDGQVYAEPLYVGGVVIPGQGTHNVVYVATQHDSVYAFDADSNMDANGGLLWRVNLGTSAATPNNDFGNRYGAYHDIDPEVGITSTPVIDLARGTLYLDAFTHEGSSYFHRIHALNITNGTDQIAPVTVSATFPGVGVGSSNGLVVLVPEQHLQRPALTLADGMLYVAYSGYADTDPYHGWVVGFNATNLQQLSSYVFNTTPNATIANDGATAGEGGIWMSGNGLSVDSNNNLYFEVGNGTFNADIGGTEYGDSFIKLSTMGALAIADYFTPTNQADLAAGDTDLGSGGPLVLPDSVGSAAHPHLLVGCGKEGKIYLLDRDNLGQFTAVDNVVQELPNAVGGTWSSPAYFNNLIFYQGSGDVLKAFQISNAAINATPASQSWTSFGFPGATPTISANGTNNAIAWVIQSDGYPGGQGILHAYNAYNLSQEIYNSTMSGTRDNPGGAIKFTVPTVVNGKVYVGADGVLSVFGNGTFIAAPTISPGGGLFTNSVTVTLSETTSGATIHYTLDNSTPTTNSPVYLAPFTLTNTTAVKAFAFKSGFVPSQVAVATFINSASLTLASGFLKQEFYSGALRTDIENPGFTTPATFIHYLTSFEPPSGQGDNYAQRISGLFTAPQTADYVFFVCSDDDSDLFLSTDTTPGNKHLIAQETAWSNSREWLSSAGGSTVTSKRSDQFSGTTWPGGNTIHLTGGSLYYIEADHHQGTGGDNLAATFKLSTDADPANGTAPALTGNAVSTYAYNNTVITINSQPQNAIGVEGYTVSFSVDATSSYLGAAPGEQGPPILFQWQSAPSGSSVFTNIPGAVSSTFTTAPLALSQDGAKYRAALSTVGFATNTAVAVVTVVTDTTPPVPLQVASVSADRRQVIISFSKPLNQASAQTASHYHVSPGSIIPSTAALDGSKTNVTLTCSSPLPQNASLVLAISGVQDLLGNSVPPGTTITFSFAVLGSGGFETELLLDHPFAYWRFNETSGTTANDYFGLHNGSYGAAAVEGVPGPRPPTLAGFEATNTAFQSQYNLNQSWVTVPPLNLNTDSVTIVAWLYPTASQAGYTGILICRNGSDASGFNYTSGDQLGYTWNNNNSATWSFMSGLVVPQNQWSFAALVVDPGEAIMYLGNSGTLVSATNPIPHQAEAFPVNSWIADDYGNGSRSFSGTMDEVAVFKAAIPGSRLAAYYQAALNGGVVVTNGPVTPAAAFSSIRAVSGHVLVQWFGSAVLEEAPAVTGPWSTSPNQNNPYLAPLTNASVFYRLRL